MTSPADVRIRAVNMGPRRTTMASRADGALLLRSPVALEPYPRCITERFEHWARAAPERIWIARRDGSGQWRTITYAQGLARMRRIAQALIDRKLSAARPIAILSDNDLEHALLAVAAQHVGVPFAPISSAYSLVSSDFSKLRFVLDKLTPGLVFASSAARYEKAIRATVPMDVELVLTEGAIGGYSNTAWSELENSAPTDAVDRAAAALDPDALAKLLFTSGSTGSPKGVITTQRMMCSTLQGTVQTMPFMTEAPPIIVDWLPWNHVFGGSHNFGMTIYAGGTLYIDDGRPVAALFEKTLTNLREIAPTVFFNVPRGFELLMLAMQNDRALRDKFFSRVKMLFYAGAGLSQPVWDAFDAMAIEATGSRILWVTGLGATETAPAVTFTAWDGVRSGHIGLPVPGVDVKLVPVDDKLEIRARGPTITPGYWREPALTRSAFDEEGYYRLGDGVRFIDPADPDQGLFFDGRIAEDFKLSSGTWVNAGPLRSKFIAAGAPYLQEVVLAGINRDELCALLLPNTEACRTIATGLAVNAPLAELVAHPAVRERLQVVLDRMAQASTGSSTLVRRAIVLDQPPSIDVGEITDKGSINQRAVLAHRAALVEALYTAPWSAQVMIARRQA